MTKMSNNPPSLKRIRSVKNVIDPPLLVYGLLKYYRVWPLPLPLEENTYSFEEFLAYKDQASIG